MCALAHHLIGNQLMFSIEEKHAELFARFVLHLAADMFQQGRPGRDHFAPADFLKTGAALQFGNGFQIGGNGLTAPIYLDEIGSWRSKDTGETAKFRFRRLGDGFTSRRGRKAISRTSRISYASSAAAPRASSLPRRRSQWPCQ